MFKKIVSQLSISPSAVGQLTFYARRLKQERVTRTFTAIAAILVVGLQSAVVLGPPAPSNASSPSDIIHGGIISRDDLLNHYDSSAELKAIYARLDITRADIAKTAKATINTKDRTLKSIGRSHHGAGDFEVNIGKSTYWMQPLWQWDTGSFVQTGSTYDVLQGRRSSDGSYFAVMFVCGNIVTKTYPITPTPKPTPRPTPKPTASPAPTPKPTASPKPTPTPVISLTCVSLTADTTTGERPLKVNYVASGSAKGQTIVSYIFDFGDNTPIKTSPTPDVSHTYNGAATYTATLKVKGSAGTTTANTPACSATITTTPPPAAFTKAKSALNLTQNIDAATKLAQAGDQIKYVLTTKNIGGVTSDYAVVEHITDILEYADVTDFGGATNTDGVLTWPTHDIAPGAALTTTFTVRVKNPIPATPVGTSDKYSFDLRMDNVYGNAVQINLAPPAPKQLEAASTTLPATGGPLSTFIVLLVSAFTLFFYFRSRQLLAEVKLLRGEFQGGIQ